MMLVVIFPRKKLKMKKFEVKCFLGFQRLDPCLLTFPDVREQKNASSHFSKKEMEGKKIRRSEKYSWIPQT